MRIFNKTNEEIFVRGETVCPGSFIDFIEYVFDTTVVSSATKGSITITTEYRKRWFDMGCKFLCARETEEKDSQGLPVIEIFEKEENITDEMSDTSLITKFIETDYFEDDKLHGYRCANCGFSFTTHFIKCHNYCYNCGAINIDSDLFKKRRENN